MGVIGLEDLITLYTTTTSLYGDKIPTEDLGTTLTTTISSASMNGEPNNIVHSSAAREYVSSMSNEELDDLLLKIEEKEFEITYEEGIEQANVKKLKLTKDTDKKHQI